MRVGAALNASSTRGEGNVGGEVRGFDLDGFCFAREKGEVVVGVVDGEDAVAGFGVAELEVGEKSEVGEKGW